MKKIYLALFAALGLTMTAEAQRNIKLQLIVSKPAMDTNLKTGSTVPVSYLLSNIGKTAADSLQAGDTIIFNDATNAYSGSAFTGSSRIVMAGSLPSGFYITVSYSGGVPFANVKTLVDPATFNLVSSPFTSNKMYYWFALGFDVIRGAGNIGITTDTTFGDTGRVWINRTTAINEVAKNGSNAEVLSYPNPATNDLHFTATVAASEDFVAQVIDMAGRLVHIHHFGKVAAGEHTFDLNLATIPAGTYTLKLGTGDEIQTSRFSVTK